MKNIGFGQRKQIILHRYEPDLDLNKLPEDVGFLRSSIIGLRPQFNTNDAETCSMAPLLPDLITVISFSLVSKQIAQ